jgi:hypothetical protein
MIVSGGDAAVGTLVLLLILYVVAMLWNLVRHPRISNLIHLAALYAVFFVGWTVRTWPSRQRGDGPLLSLLMAWRDAVLTLAFLLLKLFGVWDAWEAVRDFVSPFFEAAK